MYLTKHRVDTIAVNRDSSVEYQCLNTILGCLIVEVHDHRLEATEIKRVVMKPTAESIWTDVALLSEDWGLPWTEEIALEVEAQILVSSHQFIVSQTHAVLDCDRGTTLFGSVDPSHPIL